MAPLQRFHLLSQHLFDDSEIDEGFAIIQLSSTPLQPCTTKSSNVSFCKGVAFSDSIEICVIENKKSFSEEHKSQIWYKKKEFNRFKENCRRIVDWVSSRHPRFSLGPLDDNDDEMNYCVRGLERFTREGTIKYLERTHAKGNDLYVLRLTGATPDEIAHIMAHHSTPCVAEAQERARQDARAARRYQKEQHKQVQNYTLPDMLPRIRIIRDQRGAFYH